MSEIFRQDRVALSRKAFGEETVDMLMRVHQDALWILENLGVHCLQPEMRAAFQRHEAEGLVFLYENRIYVTEALVAKALETVPGLDDFFVPPGTMFIGGTAPYVYDDEKGEGGIFPTADHARAIARFAQESPSVGGMGRGIKLKDEVEQIGIMASTCQKPLYFAVTSDQALARAREIFQDRQDLMIVFCLTRPPLEVNENFSDSFVKVCQAGLPIFISAMPMAGISAPFCFSGVLAMTHAEVMFGIVASQLIHPGVTAIHAGFPTLADPRLEYNPNYGLASHNLLNILQSHLNMMLNLPTCQSGGTTHEEHLTDRAYRDARMGQALFKKYGVHMMRHPFSFLRYLVDFSLAKMERTAAEFPEVTAEEAPEVVMPAYDEGGMKSIMNIGTGSYMQDPLTTANFGRVFVD